MLEARDAFGPSTLIMPVCRVGTGRRASVMIKIMPRICLCVARRQVIRHLTLLTSPGWEMRVLVCREEYGQARREQYVSYRTAS